MMFSVFCLNHFEAIAYHMIMKLTICDLKEFNLLLMRLFLCGAYKINQ